MSKKVSPISPYDIGDILHLYNVLTKIENNKTDPKPNKIQPTKLQYLQPTKLQYNLQQQYPQYIQQFPHYQQQYIHQYPHYQQQYIHQYPHYQRKQQPQYQQYMHYQPRQPHQPRQPQQNQYNNLQPKNKIPTVHEKCLEYGYVKGPIKPKINNKKTLKFPTVDEMCIEKGYFKPSSVTSGELLGGSKSKRPKKTQRPKPRKSKRT